MTIIFPPYLSLLFILTTVGALLLFILVIGNASPYSARKMQVVAGVLICWLVLQGVLALCNVYNTGLTSLAPRLLVFGILPPMLLITVLFLVRKGRIFIDSLPLEPITLLNVVRIPVEIGLFRLYVVGAVPQLMTFEGGNLDLISGVTAPLVYYYAFIKRSLSKKLLLAWNFICLGLLINIVARAILSLPLPFQEFAFSRPNIAIINFPFVWLPTFIVPIALFGHLTSIRQLLIQLTNGTFKINDP